MLSTIIVVGLNHTSAPVRVREQAAPLLCLGENAFTRMGIGDPALFSEALALVTCNRTEIYAVTSDPTRAVQVLREALRVETALAPLEPNYLYENIDRAAVCHLFAVTSGIDSLVLGEFEILGQVRRAYEQAVEQQRVGSVFHSLFQTALRVGKRVRAETEIGNGPQSVASAAIALAQSKLGDLSDRTALVIGAGEMGRRAAENLRENSSCNVIITSRTYQHAADVAQRIHGQAIPFPQLRDALSQVELVISAARAPHLILHTETLAAIMQKRSTRPLCLIDLAVPRNIEPTCAEIDNVQLFNIDDLNQVVAHTRALRAKALAQVQAILAQETETFWQAHLARRAAPVLRELYTRAEQLRQTELDKTMRLLNHLALTEREREMIAALSNRLVSKLLAAPTTKLKAHMQNGNGQQYLDVLRELFDLETTE